MDLTKYYLRNQLSEAGSVFGNEMDVPDQSLLLAEKAAKRAARNSRVHFVFDGEPFLHNPEEENQIVVKAICEERYKNIRIYLGFLQQHHNYEIKFCISMDDLEGYCGPSGENVLKIERKPISCHITGMKWIQSPRRLEVNMEVQVVGPLVFEDQFTLKSDISENFYVTVKLSAQVLGKGMGTPFLKDGIRCVGLPPDDTASDISTEEQLKAEDI